MMIHIRPIIFTDAPGLLPLLSQLGYPTTLDMLELRMQRLMADQDYGVVVATHETRLIGCVAWTYTPVFVADKTRIRIEGLIVDEGYRGQGIGKQLMKHVEDWVRSDTPCIIELTSGTRRAKDGSHDFYKALGYANEGPMAKLYLRKEIEDEDYAN